MKRLLVVVFLLVLLMPIPSQARPQYETQELIDEWEEGNEIHFVIRRDWYFSMNVTDTNLIITQWLNFTGFNNSMYFTELTIEGLGLQIDALYFQNGTEFENGSVDVTLWKEGSEFGRMLLNKSDYMNYTVNWPSSFDLWLPEMDMPYSLQWEPYFEMQTIDHDIEADLHLFYTYEAVFEVRAVFDWSPFMILGGIAVFIFYVCKIRPWWEERNRPPPPKKKPKPPPIRSQVTGKKKKPHKDKKGHRKRG